MGFSVPQTLAKNFVCVALAISLSGCISVPKNGQELAAQIQTQLNDAGVRPSDTGRVAVRNKDQRVQRAMAQAQVPQPRANLMRTRPAASTLRLFAQGSASGSELIKELKAIREAAASQRSGRAVASFIGAGTSGKPGANKLSLKEAGYIALDAVLDQVVINLSHKALDGYLAELTTDQKDRLFSQNIKLPNPQSLSPEAQQRILTMAAIVVATRATKGVLESAQSDFSGLESNYAKLLNQREEAAKLLYTALQDGSESARSFRAPLTSGFGDRLAKMSIREFSGDFAAQNLAIEFIRKTQPENYNQYRADVADTMLRTRAYVKTVAGAAAFGGLLAIYGKEVSKIARSDDGPQVVGTLPFIWDFVTEAPTLLKLSTDVAINGVGVDIGKSLFPKRFKVTRPDGTEEKLSDADAVFDFLKGSEAQPLFERALFTDDSHGLMSRLWQCEPGEAGRLIDMATDEENRTAFSDAYLHVPDANFLFADSLSRSWGAKDRRLSGLPMQLLNRDHRRSSADSTMALSKIQKSVATGYTNWGDDELMKIMFSNREGDAATATMQLGDLSIRPIPSAQALFVYESLIDGCRSAPSRRT